MMNITGSVGVINGRQCRNRTRDQEVVMSLLNDIPASKGGTMETGGARRKWGPAPEGTAMPELHQAILNFQRANRHEGLLVDGHVDPGHHCIQVLNRLADEPKTVPQSAKDFQFVFLPNAAAPLDNPVAIISCRNDTGVNFAYYHFQPRAFADAITRRFRVFAKGVEAFQFQTPEPMSPTSFNGPSRLVEQFNDGLTAVSFFYFSGAKADGNVIQLSFRGGTEPKAGGTGEILSGSMSLLDDRRDSMPVKAIFARPSMKR